MNAYGFAGGDRINFSDPFGLCKDGDLNCAYLVKTLREHGGSAFNAAAGRYDALKSGVVSFIAKSQLPEYWRMTDTRGLTDQKTGNVFLVGESTREDFLVTAVHESIHLTGAKEDDPRIGRGVLQAFMQLSPSERAKAGWSKKWLDDRGIKPPHGKDK